MNTVIIGTDHRQLSQYFNVFKKIEELKYLNNFKVLFERDRKAALFLNERWEEEINTALLDMRG